MNLLDRIVGFEAKESALQGWHFTERLESQRVRVAQSRTALLLVSGGSLVYLIGLWNEVDQSNLLLWVFLCSGFAILRERICAFVEKSLENITVAKLYRNELLLYFSSLASTTSVGSGFWLLAYNSSDRVVLAVTLLCCLYAIGSTANSAMHSRHIVSLIGTNLGQGVLFMLIGRTPADFEVAFVLGGLGFLLVKFCHRIAALYESSMQIRDENREKNEKLEEQKLLIEQALMEARAANEDKNRFLAAASHDLRQPLHAMTLFLGSLRRAVKDDLALELVGKIDETASILNHQFDSLLDLSKFDAGVIEPNISYFHLDSLLKRVVDSVRPSAQQKGLDIELTTQPQVVASDILLLERLIRNLAVNAVQYTSEGTISVSTRLENNGLLIAIADSGLGIDEENQRRIFHDFYQVHNRARTKGRGSGLGLAIVRRIATLLNMRLSVASELGHGSVFTVSIPESVLMFDSKKAATITPVNLAAGNLLDEVNLHGRRILLVDDDKTILDALSRVIRDWGGEALLASSFAEVRKLSENSPGAIDLAILDDMLNETTTGLDIAKYLSRKMPRERIVITTGNTAKDRLAEIRHNGFEVLIKPVDYLILSRTIEEILR